MAEILRCGLDKAWGRSLSYVLVLYSLPWIFPSSIPRTVTIGLATRPDPTAVNSQPVQYIDAPIGQCPAPMSDGGGEKELAIHVRVTCHESNLLPNAHGRAPLCRVRNTDV